MNDPYLGGTHFNDVRIVRPIFHEDELIAYSLSNGHWADVGGSVPGSFDINAKEHFQEGLRVPPVRLWDQGALPGRHRPHDRVEHEALSDAEGDLHAQAESTRVAEREILRLVEKYGRDTVVTAFSEVQDYVERLTRQRVAELLDGTWETEDYMDLDPSGEEGLIPIRVKLTIEGDQIHYDLTGSHPVVGRSSTRRSARRSPASAGTKTFFPDVPLNSGFYRVVTVDMGPEGTVVNAPWPVAVTGFCSGPYEKIMNAIFELWSGIMPERAIACSFNLEYLLVGGRDVRRPGADLHVVRLDGRRLGLERQGRLQRDRADLRRGARRTAARGAGASAPCSRPAPARPGLGRPRPVPRRPRRREGRDADRRGRHGDVLPVRPGARSRGASTAVFRRSRTASG